MSNPGPSRIRNTRTNKALVNYNNFFNPYLCHVCKTSTNLQICHSCRLISYCSKEHLQLHREQHKEFCLAVLSLSNEIYYSHNMTLKEWTALKKANVKRVKHKLGRNLEPYEEQILLFAKSCLICRRQNNLSVVCKSCTSVSMCYRHISTPYVHTCYYLKLCITLDILSAVRSERNTQIPLEVLNFTYLTDMSTYFTHLGRSCDFDTWSYVNFLHTNYLSRPLTLIYYLPSANIELMFSTIFIIHVIAGSFTDRNSQSAWEAFLHQLLPDTSLMIIMIGPKLEKSVYKIHLCQTCHRQNKEILRMIVRLF
ncbi:uncharacterized protein LOC116846881 isoform X2 [Odontomachus brunneus]|uniref:uncharacterized protein LOC116846881 isoform X2 n=1 Tax=Odontomachus brunneus TaxID=486640 RepID=UPI0013F27504|nr:uncharacterized protein LOC116846881 isoform X2 [Odontomachus brunneus]